MTESRSYGYEIPWHWYREQLKEKIRKNKVVTKIRNDLQKTRLVKNNGRIR